MSIHTTLTQAVSKKKRRNLRERIVQILQSHHYLTVSELMKVLEKADRAFNKSSVYRAIEKLIAEKMICRHSFGTDKVYYELRHEDGHHHDHFVCKKCKQIKYFDCLLDVAKLPKGYALEHHHITLFGICDACQNHVVQQNR